jgi:hypothetical protein
MSSDPRSDFGSMRHTPQIYIGYQGLDLRTTDADHALLNFAIGRAFLALPF